MRGRVHLSVQQLARAELVRVVGLVSLPALHAAAVQHSDAYQTRAKIHKYASYATLPLFAGELALGQSLFLGRRPRISRVHDFNPLEQTFICLSAGVTHGPPPAGLDMEAYLAAFGV